MCKNNDDHRLALSLFCSALDIYRGHRSPYALEVAGFHEIDASGFYTLSAKGITAYAENEPTEFTSLDQWEREYRLYDVISKMKVFQKHRTWKGFNVWKRGVRRSKISRCQTSLSENLFHLIEAFQDPLLSITKLCSDMRYLRLHRLKKGDLYTLDGFLATQSSLRDEVRGIYCCCRGLVSF